MTRMGKNATALQRAEQHRVHLRVLSTTDLHAHLLPFDYFTDTRAPGTGLARLASMIARQRAEVPNVLLVDNGDTLQGTPLADTALTEIVPAGRPNPMIAAMNAIGFDAATLGNHDFDFGMEYLEMSLSQATFPLVLANVCRADGTVFLPPSCVLTRQVRDQGGDLHDIRIGITGAVPPQTAHWNKPHVKCFLLFDDIVAAVSAQVTALRAQGADLVLVLAHSGYGKIDAAPFSENVALQLAALPGVDAVVAGHTHKARPEGPPAPVEGTPMVQAGAFGSHLGCIDLMLDRTGANRWQVHQALAGTFDGAPALTRQGRPPLRRILTDYPDLRPAISLEHRATRAFVARALGESAVALETYFSTLAPCAATQLVADAQCIAAHPLIAEFPVLAGLPVLSAVAPFKAGGRSGPAGYTDVPPGPLMLRHAADLYLYPNMLSILRLSGAGLASWLERSASIYRQIDPDSDVPQRLIDHEYAPYNFDRIDGLTYQIDVSRPARTNAEGDQEFDTPGRIRNLRFADGRPVAPDDQALVVTNSYRAAGGGHMDAAGAADEIVTADFSVRDAVARYIAQSNGPIQPRISPTFTLRPLGGVPVIFETGPGALAHADRATALGLTPMDDAATARASGGFQAYLLTL